MKPHPRTDLASACSAARKCPGLGVVLTCRKGNKTQWRLGTGFLKNVYTVFDFETPAVGFAKLSDGAQPDVKPSRAGATTVSGAVLAAALAVGCLW